MLRDNKKTADAVGDALAVGPASDRRIRVNASGKNATYIPVVKSVCNHVCGGLLQFS